MFFFKDKNEFNEKYFQQQQQQQKQQSLKFNYVNQPTFEEQNKDESSESAAAAANQNLDSSHLSLDQKIPAPTSYSITLSGTAQSSLYKTNLITVDNLTKDVLHRLFNLAHDLKVLTLSEKDLTSMLRGKLISLMFFEPSTRTQCSFVAAAHRLGGTVIYMDSQHSSMKKGNYKVFVFFKNCLGQKWR